MGMSYAKVKSVAKKITPEGPGLSKTILKTMKTISDVVGATLGPGGKPVLIERQELNMPPIITKDGVTVFRSLGFLDSTEHVIMEAARDAAIRTANEAGDGTTTATILAEAIVRNMSSYLGDNPRISPQTVVREIEHAFQDEIKPLLNKEAIRVKFGTEDGDKILHAIARVSGNGDTELADAVIKCFGLVGDEGNVTLVEASGPSGYEVEEIDGYPIPMGYEESCAKYFTAFINDQANQRIFLENPLFILYHGSINESNTFLDVWTKIYEAYQSDKGFPHNIVLISSGFSEAVLVDLMLNFADPSKPHMVPLVIPKSPILNGDKHFLEDIAAFTGGKIFDPINNPLYGAELTDLGRSMTSFECYRYRSQLIGEPDEVLVSERIDALKVQLSQAASKLEESILNERIGKISGGIAKLRVVGSSNGELREKRDRAEDAVCAVRGTIRDGCLPGGGWSLLMLYDYFSKKDKQTVSINMVLMPSLLEPIYRLLSNSGLNKEDSKNVINDMLSVINNHLIYDAELGKMVYALNTDRMIVDSLPAVADALKNSISIAALLGTTGGVVVFGRDLELERQEGSETNQFLKNTGQSPELELL